VISISSDMSLQAITHIVDTAEMLRSVQAGRSISPVPDYLSRDLLPGDLHARLLAVIAYATALVPSDEPSHRMARDLLAGAMLIIATLTNDRPDADPAPVNATPELVVEFIHPLLKLVRPAIDDPLDAYLDRVCGRMDGPETSPILIRLFEPLLRASALERRQAIQMAEDAMALLCPPYYHRVATGERKGQPIFDLVRQPVQRTPLFCGKQSEIDAIVAEEMSRIS
jgi:hypothetical protein